MNSEADFIAALEASPGDRLLLRAFADWLEEQGDPRAAWIRSPGPALRRFMGPKFEDLIPKMIEALKVNQLLIEVRTAAAAVGAACVPAMVELLKHEDGYVRQQALFCLRKVGKAAAEAVPALLEALKDKDHRVREQAAKALKVVRPKKGTDVANLRDALADGHWAVRRQAAGILGGLGAKGEVVGQLTAQLDDPDPAARLAAVQGLATLKSKQAVLPLCRALADDADTVRRAAA